MDTQGGPVCYINGKCHSLPLGRGHTNLLTYLRECGLTGTKLGCGEGGCGACTVMISCLEDGEVVHMAVNACLYPLYAAEGKHVVTVEGIGNVKDGLHPVQERLSQSHGSQCGYCTPGFVMSMYSLLRSKGRMPSEREIEDCLAGNLCRCTGYRPILDAFKTFAVLDASDYTKESLRSNGIHSSNDNGSKEGSKVCPSTGQPCGCGDRKDCTTVKEGAVLESTTFPSDPIFPPTLHKHRIESLSLKGTECSWHRPTSLDELLNLKHSLPHAKLVVGNSEIGIEMKFKHAGYSDLIDVNHVPELNKREVNKSGMSVGASVSLTKVMHMCKAHNSGNLSIYSAIARQLRWFAGNQIRNVASLGGNMVTGSPISDLNPLMIAGSAVLRIEGKGSGVREVGAADFFLGYRKVDLEPHEVVREIFIPASETGEFVKEFKQAHRREDDIAIVTAGMRVKFGALMNGERMIENCTICFGGVASKTKRAVGTEESLAGKPWNSSTFKDAMDAVKSDIVIPHGAPGGMSEYRCSLAASFLFKFFLCVSKELDIALPATYMSSVEEFERPACRGVQYFAEASPEDEIVGKPIRHMAADMQVSGEAKYCDDIEVPGCLHGALVTSTSPHARILKVDASKATQLAGVLGYYGHKEVPGSNAIGTITLDEEAFASDMVTCVGQTIGIVVAESQFLAQKAARLVSVEYEEMEAVLSINEAIEAKSFYDTVQKLECGDVDSAFADCEHVVEGESFCGGQEHFYLESQACIVIPGEDNEFQMIASTQDPNGNINGVSRVLGIPKHKIVCKVKRIGGGFGGKETRSMPLNAAAAVPAYHLKKPVRLCLDRDEDMKITGHRHAFLSKYKIGFNGDGKILAADVKLFCNAGNTMDLSAPVMYRAVHHADAAYKIPHMRVRGFVCKTNMPSNTAFRGFGGPQGSLLLEMCVERVAKSLEKSAEVIRELNLYQEGDKAHYGQVLDACRIQRCWDDIRKCSKFDERSLAVQDFNLKNKFRKRGIAITPVKFGISFGALFLNQGGALVNIYTDGSVLVTHGGVEMGQGLHTKMCQVAASALKVPLSSVHISETATDKVPNASPTAASVSSDIYGAAILDACQQINKRLAPFREKMPNEGFEDVVRAAHMERVDLSAHGFYITPDINEYPGTMPFNYHCYGTACSEVEVDVLTGDWHALRVDIVMDVGNPINPAIDIGQVEGGFVQGMGWLCTEELVWGDNSNPWIRKGHLQTCGPGTYKIPTANDIPIDFRVSLLENSTNTRAIHSSKAVGEPPFLLANSVLFALKNAIYASRRDAGLEGWFRLDAPCTPEKVRMASGATDVEALKAFLPE